MVVKYTNQITKCTNMQFQKCTSVYLLKSYNSIFCCTKSIYKMKFGFNALLFSAINFILVNILYKSFKRGK